MTASRGEIAEAWLWRGERCCRLLVEGAPGPLPPGFTAAGPGCADVVATLRRADGSSWELSIRGESRESSEKIENTGSLAERLRRALDWPWIDGELLERRGQQLWLVGEGAATLREHLCAKGWSYQGAGASPDVTAELIWAGRRPLTGGHLVRCLQKPDGVDSPTLDPAEPDEAQGWLHGDREGRAVVIAAFAPMRLVYGDGEAARLALEGLSSAPALAPPPPQTRERTLALGDGCLRLVTDGLDDDDERHVDYLTAPLLTTPSATTALFALRVQPVRWMVSLEPTHWRGGGASSIATTLLHLDNALQRGLLELDRVHAIFLGSAVQREDTVVWLSGLRNSGKTSLAIELVERHGFSVVADDFVPWHPDEGRLSLFQKPFRLRAGGFDAFPELADVGIRVPPTEETSAVWFVNPTVDTDAAVVRPGGRGLFVRCFLDPTLTEPVRIEMRPRARVVSDLQRSPRPPIDRAALATSVEAIADRFEGLNLWYRDRSAAARAIAERIIRRSSE